MLSAGRIADPLPTEYSTGGGSAWRQARSQRIQALELADETNGAPVGGHLTGLTAVVLDMPRFSYSVCRCWGNPRTAPGYPAARIPIQLAPAAGPRCGHLEPWAAGST